MAYRQDKDQQPDDLVTINQRLKLNERIWKRMDHVERFLIGNRDLEPILTELPGVITVLYQLEGAGFFLNQDYDPLAETLENIGLPPGRPNCYTGLTAEQMAQLSGRQRRTRLIDQPNLELLALVFPEIAPAIKSLAAIPLKSSENDYGYLVLASRDPERYRPGLSVDFLQRLGEKIGLHLENALNMNRLIHLEKERAVIEMAGAACHEINQPLTVILGLAELLQNENLTPADRERHVKTLLGQAQRLADLTKKISTIRTYKTRDYVQGTKIIDIDGAGAPEN
ncbi:MAG: DUF484 family protein [Proteobacteria bacterium]|nr:DUF484 family protein [Pseudomonadota bacterium]